MNNTTNQTPFSEVVQERDLVKRGLTAPRLTPDDINAVIAEQYYTTIGDTKHVICLLVLKNGFTVSGENACASPENWREDIAREMAYKQARDKVWELEGYLLKQKLYEEKLNSELQI